MTNHKFQINTKQQILNPKRLGILNFGSWSRWLSGLFVICCLSFTCPVFFGGICFASAQQSKTDSLLSLLKKDKEDTNKVIHLNTLSREYLNIADYDSMLHYSNAALQLAQQLSFKKGIANSYSNIGIVYRNQGNYLKALDCYLKALKIDEELKDKSGMAKRLGNIGTVYHDQADYPKTLDYYLRALKLDEELGNQNGIARHLGNIGGVYMDQGDHPKALDYYFRALKMGEALEDKNGIAIRLSNIGNVYINQADYHKALDYYFKALKMDEEFGNKNGIALHFSTIAELYTKAPSLPPLPLTGTWTKEERNFPPKAGLGWAEKYLLKALAINKEIGAQNEERKVEESLSKLYEKTNRHNLALIHYKKAMALKDTIFSEEKNKELTRKEMNYEFERKEAAQAAERQKQEAVAAAEKQRQKIVLYFVLCTLFIVLVFAGFIFRALRITRKQKALIEQQKKLVEEKQNEILASIRYAKRIQDALLPTEKYIHKHLERLRAKMPE